MLFPYWFSVWLCWLSQVVLVVKNPPASTRDIRDAGSISGSGRSPGGEHGKLLQHSYLESPMDRGPWRATVHRVTESRTRLKWLSTALAIPSRIEVRVLKSCTDTVSSVSPFSFISVHLFGNSRAGCAYTYDWCTCLAKWSFYHTIMFFVSCDSFCLPVYFVWYNHGHSCSL